MYSYIKSRLNNSIYGLLPFTWHLRGFMVKPTSHVLKCMIECAQNRVSSFCFMLRNEENESARIIPPYKNITHSFVALANCTFMTFDMHFINKTLFYIALQTLPPPICTAETALQYFKVYFCALGKRVLHLMSVSTRLSFQCYIFMSRH